MKRVAITGIGTINAIARHTKEYGTSLREMKIGIERITQFDCADYPAKMAAEVKNFDPNLHFEIRIANRYDRFLQLAIVAARNAVEDAGLSQLSGWQERAAVTVSSGIGGFKTLHREYQNLIGKGPKAVRPHLIPMMISDMASGAIAIDLGCRGPNFGVVSACASSLHAIIITALLIKQGITDIALTGGTEAVIDPMPVAAFGSMTALSPESEDPAKASRPFAKGRNGFVMGEGAGVLVLESEAHAKERGARIYGWIEGFGMSEDAFHISQTDPEGKGASKAMGEALKRARVSPDRVDLINCHATGTPVGDISEIRALRSVFGDTLASVPIQSTKALVGHTLGAAGAVELIGTILQTENGFVHGMPGLEEVDAECANVWIPKETVERKTTVVLKNAFGFGGHNASIVYKKEGQR
jgi:3-oxoacyl-[acyl-carrier-protein] synthase II